jgi:hypothetical protein
MKKVDFKDHGPFIFKWLKITTSEVGADSRGRAPAYQSAMFWVQTPVLPKRKSKNYSFSGKNFTIFTEKNIFDK